ncbi:MAG: formate--tetrahydrofolate ligase [Plesiomonas shigelloides]
MKTDSQICQEAALLPVSDVAQKAGFLPDEVLTLGEHKAKIRLQTLQRTAQQPDGKFVLVSAITPTPLGEGKTVTTIGLAQGLAALGEKTIACIRQPSMGPVFGVKGGAAGGGYSQVAPMDELNLHLTGDIHAITAAHNLAAAALDARLYHESRLGAEHFTERTGLPRLDIDPQQIVWNRVMDHNDRALRKIRIGINPPGSHANGIERESGFDITAASELMAILALAQDLPDMRQRLGRLILAYNHAGEPITAEALGVAGAMAAIMKDAINPTLMQTLEGVPVLIHAGPFANIAHGNSSITADKMALKLADYTVTEAGFGSDMGLEKACNIKAQVAGKAPDCVVLVATLRGLKANSGRYNLKPGQAIPPSLFAADQEALEVGFANLQWHMNNVQKYGLPVVVAVNRFPQDTDAELQWLCHRIEETGRRVALSDAFSQGGQGALALAQAVMQACEQPATFTPLYQPTAPLLDKLNAVASKGYGAKCVELSPQAQAQLAHIEQLGQQELYVCLAKTPLSISHDPALKGAPQDFVLPIRELNLCAGAGFVYALCGNVLTMPGLPEHPAYLGIDITADGTIVGLG